MDTISRDTNSSMLPVGAIIVGVIALLLGGYAAISVSKMNRLIAEQQTKLERIDALEASAASATNASASAERVAKDLQSLTRSTQEAFNAVSNELGKLGTSITKLEDSTKRPVPTAAERKSSAPAVAGPGEYIVKTGDTGMKIAGAHGVPVGDLMAVNPGVNWSALKIGQKLKLPAKK